MKEQLLSLINEKKDLPPLPEVLIKIDEALKSQRTSISDISDLIVSEPVLSAKVIKLANSAFYGGGRKEINTLQMAISRLGLNMVRKLVYSLNIVELFPDSKIINQRKFWRHSLGVALLTQELSRLANVCVEEEEKAYLAGLMHDVGLMVFSYLIPGYYLEFLRIAVKKKIPLHIQEREIFGLDHAELGATFIEQWWGLEYSVIDPIKFHHFPFGANQVYRPIEQLVHVANAICNNQGITNGIPVYNEMFRNSAWEELGLHVDDVKNVLRKVRENIEQTELLLGEMKEA